MTTPAGLPVPVLTAVTNPSWEAQLVAASEAGLPGLRVVRRCVDLADLLATAPTGVAQAALISADLRRLDRDALARLAAASVAVVGVVPAGDEAAERRLRQLGVATLVADDAVPDGTAAVVRAAVAAGPVSAAGFSSPLPGQPVPGQPIPTPPLPGQPAGSSDDAGRPAGRVIAVWGPTGAPGRTSVAVGLAAELAPLVGSVALVDADVYGGSAAQVLGFLEETPGLAAACRLANTGGLDVPKLAALARQAAPRPARTARHLPAGPLAGTASRGLRDRAHAVSLARRGHRRRLRVQPGGGRGAGLRHGRATTQRGDPGGPRGGRHRDRRRDRRPGRRTAAGAWARRPA